MKKLLALSMTLVMLLTAGMALADGEDTLAKIKEKGTLTIAMEGVWQTWTYHDESGALTGFDVEVGALVAEGLGVTPEYVETDDGLTSRATASDLPRNARNPTRSAIFMCIHRWCWWSGTTTRTFNLWMI